MKIGASVSGAAHVALVAAAIFSGQLFAEQEARAVNVAEVDLMTGTEFEAAFSAAPTVDASRAPSAPTPTEAPERADVTVAEEDLAPTTFTPNADVEAPRPGEAVQPLEEPPETEIAELGEQPAAPLAPEADVLISATDLAAEIAPISERPSTPSAAPAPPQPELSTPQSAPAPEITETTQPQAPATPESAEAPAAEDAPTRVATEAAPSPRAKPSAPTPETAAPSPSEAPEIVATAAPDQAAPAAPEEAPAPEAVESPSPETPRIAAPAPAAPTAPSAAPTPDVTNPAPPVEVAEAEEAETAAPKLAPPPPKRPASIAEAAQATRTARAATPRETGATNQAEAPQGGGTSRTVGRLSFRDKDSLRVGIKGYFSPPPGIRNEDIFVTIRVELTRDGKLAKKARLIKPGGALNARQKALLRAGMRAIGKSAAAGVFARLPKDKYERWRRINVTFTPKEIRFL